MMRVSSLILSVPVLLVAACAQVGESKPEQAKSLKVLSIGNSFSESLRTYFPAAVASVPGCSVEFENLMIGGCPLKRHWENIEKEETDPSYRYFKTFSYKEKLQGKKWDIVTIQQASGDSWNYDTYMPYARNIRDFVKKHAPQAEVVIQQTWAYRQDEGRLSKWNMTQEEMFKRLSDAYNKAGAELGLRIIPTGSAVQLVRETQPVKYKPFNAGDYKYPALPDTNPSLIGGVKWSDDHKKIVGDAAHLNKRGEYLQACVWFSSLYGMSAERITLSPKELSPEDAKFLRSAAQKAVENFKQAKR